MGIYQFLSLYKRSIIIVFLLLVPLLLYVGLKRFPNTASRFTHIESTSYGSKIKFVSVEPLLPILKSPNTREANDQDKDPDRIEMLREVVGEMRNLPRVPFVAEKPSKNLAYNNSCATFPSILDLQFTNSYWQRANTSWGTFFMYGAYYDNRNLTSKVFKGPVVRVLGVIEHNFEDDKPKDFCHLWFEKENKPVIIKIAQQEYIFYSKTSTRTRASYLFACPIPSTHHHKVPKSVSIVSKPCDNARNSLGVQYEKSSSRKGFAVCIKGFDFPGDLSLRLIEWFELHRALGAEKIFFYKFNLLHQNVSKVLDYYERTGFLDVTPYTLPGYLPDEPHLRHLYLQARERKPEIRRTEIIPYNDCLYRNLYKYEYLAVVDTDEIIMPLTNISTWNELVNIVKKDKSKDFQSWGAICFQNVYFFENWMKEKSFFPEIPSYMYHLQNVYRGNNTYRRRLQSKCFHIVDKVLTLYNHAPIKCLNSCKKIHVPYTQAHMQHYKPKCPSYLRNCTNAIEGNPILDTAIWRYKDEVIKKSKYVTKTLGLITD